MTEPGAAAPAAGPVELLDDGRGDPPPPRRLAWLTGSGPWSAWSAALAQRLGQRARLVLGALAVAGLVLGTVVVSGHQPHPGRQLSAATTPPPAQLQLLLDQYTFSAQPGTFSLQLSVVNYGPDTISMLATHLPQTGAIPVPGPGGGLPLTHPIVLPPAASATLVVSVTVACPQVLAAPLADHLDVTVGRRGSRGATVRLPLSPLATLLDEARHAACGVASASASIYPSYLAGTVRSPRRHVVTATLRVTDVGDAAAQVTVAGTEPASLRLSPASFPVTVRPGQA